MRRWIALLLAVCLCTAGALAEEKGVVLEEARELPSGAEALLPPETLKTDLAFFSAPNFAERTEYPEPWDAGARFYHDGTYNPFVRFGYGMPNCTAYAYGRAYEVTGTAPMLPTSGAGRWWTDNQCNYQNGCGYPSGQTPAAGAIACYPDHVAFVERIDGDTIWMSESAWSGHTNPNNRWFYQTKDKTDRYNGTCYGYIYACGEPEAQPAPPPADDPVAGFVTRLYRVVLGREPEAQGLAEQTALLKNHGTTGAYLASQFFLSPEYTAKGKTDAAFLQDIYAAFFDRPPDEEGLANWKSYLEQGCSWEFVLAHACTSREFTGICSSYGIERGGYASTQNRDQNPAVTSFVNRVYTVVLGRQGEPEGLNNWTGLLLNGGITGADLVNNAYFCEEYEAKHTADEAFVSSLYYFLVDRPPDEAGMANWLGLLKAGHSRRFVVARCVAGEEFTRLCAQYGITRGSLTEN